MKHLYYTSVESEHRLNEMVRVSAPEDKLKDGAEIWIYGENNEQGTKVPHFHVIRK